MFLNYIKDFFVKKRLNNSFKNVKYHSLSGIVNNIGLIVDEKYFSQIKDLMMDLAANGVLEDNIEVIVLGDRCEKGTNTGHTIYCSKHLKWNGKINNPSINDFVDKEFDLLISYYDIEKAILLIVTNNSKAHFKVGFSSIDNRLNNLMIDTTARNQKIFTHELFRYLKILKKIE
jgi:hypothetical protein